MPNKTDIRLVTSVADENYPSREFYNNSLFSDVPCKCLTRFNCRNCTKVFAWNPILPNPPYCSLGISKGSINHHTWSQSWCLCSLSLPHSRRILTCPQHSPIDQWIYVTFFCFLAALYLRKHEAEFIYRQPFFCKSQCYTFFENKQ